MKEKNRKRTREAEEEEEEGRKNATSEGREQPPFSFC